MSLDKLHKSYVFTAENTVCAGDLFALYVFVLALFVQCQSQVPKTLAAFPKNTSENKASLRNVCFSMLIPLLKIEFATGGASPPMLQWLLSDRKGNR